MHHIFSNLVVDPLKFKVNVVMIIVSISSMLWGRVQTTWTNEEGGGWLLK